MCTAPCASGLAEYSGSRAPIKRWLSIASPTMANPSAWNMTPATDPTATNLSDCRAKVPPCLSPRLSDIA